MEIITYKNTGSEPVRLKNSGMGDVHVKPGQQVVLPIEYATLNVGHPRARNEGKNLWRDIAYTKARRRWGFYPGLMTEAEWDEMKPTIELYTLDGVRLYSVLDDPSGALGNPEVLTGEATAGGQDFLQQQVMAMQAQIAQLTALIAQQQNPDQPSQTVAATAPAPEPPFDPLAAAVSAMQAMDEPDIDSGAIPPPPATEAKPRKDSPRTTRVGGSV